MVIPFPFIEGDDPIPSKTPSSCESLDKSCGSKSKPMRIRIAMMCFSGILVFGGIIALVLQVNPAYIWPVELFGAGIAVLSTLAPN